MRAPSSLLGSRVARRLVGTFVTAALLPLIVTAVVSHTAVSQFAEQLQTRSQTEATRQTGLQVISHLIVGKTMLAALPAPDESNAAGAALEGVRLVFRSVQFLGADGQADRWIGKPTDLRAVWQAAAATSPMGAAGASKPNDTPVEVALRVIPAPGAAPRLLMATFRNGRPSVLGELQPGYLWAPVADNAIDSGWRVQDSHGVVLTAQGETPLLPAPGDALSRPSTRGIVVTRTSLFLGGEFDSGDWQFTQAKAAAEPRWAGARLSVWLALVAAAAVLLAALLSLRLIRRTLVPLEKLIAATRGFGAGITQPRVDIRSNDEFGVLGSAFNDMSQRIASQFHAMAGLAAIDRDILAGKAIGDVALQVLGQLRTLHPTLVATACWRDEADPSRLICAGAQASAGEPLADDARLHRLAPMDARQSEDFGRETDDGVLTAATAADRPWHHPARQPGVTHLGCFPVRWNGATQAMLVLGAGAPLSPAVQRAAAELRDRLAVAFAAREREREMHHRALHDSLTGLANRRGLHEALERLLPHATPSQSIAVLFVDLDHFKLVNDSQGHEAGDELLCMAAERLQACLPPGGLVARQGGDEFIVVLPDADPQRAAVVAGEAVRSLSSPFNLRHAEQLIGASIGVALAPQHGQTPQELLRHADIAMYAAKGAGRGRYAVFETALDSRARERAQLLTELRHGLERGEMFAHYQPRVRPSDGCITSAEALVRWQHPQRGLLLPGHFIELAEESDLIEALGVFMLDAACAQMAHWRSSYPTLERLSVNVSPRQLRSGNLLGQVRAALDRNQLPPSMLELEITESLLVADSGDARVQLAELQRWGVSIALDDFGTGYSSMSLLRQLPIDVLKIDRFFVKDLGKDSDALAITQAIVTLAHALHLHLVAEGIETEAQATLLASLGCHELQGFLYGKALPPIEFEGLCDRTRVAVEP